MPRYAVFFLKGQKACFLAKAGKWGHIEAIKSSQMVVGNRNVMAADIHLSFHPSDKTWQPRQTQQSKGQRRPLDKRMYNHHDGRHTFVILAYGMPLAILTAEGSLYSCPDGRHTGICTVRIQDVLPPTVVITTVKMSQEGGMTYVPGLDVLIETKF